MNLFFLQVLIDSAKIKDSLAKVAMLAAQQKENLWDVLIKGGPLMIPLAILLVIAIFVFIERYLAIKKASKSDDNFMNIIRDHIVTGNISAARSLSKNTPTAVARMIDVDLPPEHRTVLAHAVIGMAEAVGRRALREATAEGDPELLAHWTAELVWYGLRGIRTGAEAAAGGWVEH